MDYWFFAINIVAMLIVFTVDIVRKRKASASH